MATAMTSDAFRCETCSKGIQYAVGCSKNGIVAQAPATRTVRGHTVEFSDCPLNLVDAELDGVVRVYSHYRAGRYVYGADLGQWPNRIVRQMEVLDDEVTKAQAEQVKG